MSIPVKQIKITIDQNLLSLSFSKRLERWLAVKITGDSSRKPGFGSQHPHGDALFWPSWHHGHCMNMVQTDRYAGKNHQINE